MKKKIKKYISGGVAVALLLTNVPLQTITGTDFDSDIIEIENEVSSNDNRHIESNPDRICSSNEFLAEDMTKTDNATGETVLQAPASDDQTNSVDILETEDTMENDRASASSDIENKGFKKTYYLKEIEIGYSNELQFEIPRSGRLRFVFSDCEDPDYHIYCYYIPSYDDIQFTITNGEETAYTNWCTVLQGTIKVLIESGTSINADATLCAEYQPGGTYVGEVEENDSFDTANEIPVNTTFWGAEGYDPDNNVLDYFYFNVDKPSKMKLSTKNLDSMPPIGYGTGPLHNIGNGGIGTGRIRLYKETKYGNIEYITSLLYYEKYFLPAMRLSSGKYFLVINPKNIGNYRVYVGLKEESDKSYEQEANNLSSKANKKNVNKWYTGNINIYNRGDGYEYDKDWYQFKITKKSYIQMELRTPRQAKGKVTANLYDPSKKSIASIESTGNPYAKTKKKLVSPGTYYIRLTSKGGDSGFERVDWDYNIRLVQKSTNKKSQSPIVNKKSLKLYRGGNAKKLKVSNSKGKITYKSSNPKVATVNAKGKVIPKKVGKTTITIKAAGNSVYKSAVIKVRVTVKNRKK